MKNTQTLNALTPGLFDLSQDIVEYVPSEIIEDWLASGRTHADAKKILSRNLAEGTVVSTDTSGLSKLGMKKDLIEVLAITNRPKEIVYTYGSAIGGQAIGIWAADNTQMFYGKDVSVDEIIAQLFRVQKDIAEQCEVTIGIGVHYGKFYNIGNGMYGPEADFIERVAEDMVEGGELVMSGQALEKLTSKRGISFTHRNDIKNKLGKIYRVEKGTGAKKATQYDHKYPIPYSVELQDDIRMFYEKPSKRMLSSLRDKYIKEKIVVLIERERFESTSYEMFILNDLSLYSIMGKIALRLLIDYEGKRIKTIGNLGIYVFSDPHEALEFTEHYRRELLRYDLGSKAGISKGEVVISDLTNGRRDIAGSPVNIISKIVQDQGTVGKIYITEEIHNKLKDPRFSESNCEASGLAFKTFCM